MPVESRTKKELLLIMIFMMFLIFLESSTCYIHLVGGLIFVYSHLERLWEMIRFDEHGVNGVGTTK